MTHETTNNDVSLLTGHINPNNFALSQCQAKTYDEIMGWLRRPVTKNEDLFYSLRGYAGTGKTTVLKCIYQDLPNAYSGRTCVSAPTHKARKVVSYKSGCKQSETVQALLGLKPDTSLEEFDIDNVVFAASGMRKINSYRLIITDEASMINSDLYDLMIKESINNRVRILFVGDELQLPPVKERKSRALLEPVNQSILNEIIRQKDTNPLIIVLDMLRKDILDGTNTFLKYLQDNPNMSNDKGEGFEVIYDNTIFSSKIVEAFCSTNYMQDRNYVRYLAWTNKSVKTVNNFIRKNGLNTDSPLMFNELMLAYNTTAFDKYDIPSIVNSNDYVIGEVVETIDAFDIKLLVAKVTSVDEQTEGEIRVVIPTPQNLDTFLGHNIERLNKAKTFRHRAWIEYYAWRNQYCLLDDLYSGRTFVAKKDIDYGYGITVHKSQGSTYDTVFVNGRDMNSNSEESDRKKLWYVALSRAATKAYIIL